MHIGAAISLLKKTYTNWSDHHAPRLGASVAFYTLLSFAPLLVLTVAVVALVFGHERAQSGLIDQAKQMIGDRGADTVKSLLAAAQKPSSGLVATIIAFVTLLFGASGVFTELREALNIIWDAKPKNESGLLGMLKQRLFSFGMVLSVGFLLLVSLIISAALAFLGKFFSQLMPVPPFVFELINFAVSFGVVTLLFALMFKFVPAREISWRDVRVGAVGTALLFTVGKVLLGLYLGKASVGSAYGAAGSLVAVIVWVYYSAQIFFFGAEFTRVYADAHASADARSVEEQKKPADDPAIGKQTLYPGTQATAFAALSPAEMRESSPQPVRPEQYNALPSHDGTPGHRKSQPSLLVAAGVGFLFGRVFATKNRRSAVRGPSRG